MQFNDWSLVDSLRLAMVQVGYTPRFGLYASYTTLGLQPSVV